jgi:peptidoglycan hydrolase-like protein with peptidoglycan-binding domain
MDGALRALLFAVSLAVASAAANAGPPTIGGGAREETVVATQTLIREIQFMLLSLSIDPGPIDGNAQQLTNRALHVFQQRNGLPENDLVNGQPVSAALVDRLRKEVAQNFLKGAKPEPEPQAAAAAPPASPPPPAASPPPEQVAAIPAAPPPDPYASCTFKSADFMVGARQYTPQSFLDDGFGGVTARAVTNLHQRLDEARQIAEKIGGPALLEVQRQARVLAYFECRQKIEQTAAEKK